MDTNQHSFVIVMVSIHGVTEHVKKLGNKILYNFVPQFFHMFGGHCMLTMAYYPRDVISYLFFSTDRQTDRHTHILDENNDHKTCRRYGAR